MPEMKNNQKKQINLQLSPLHRRSTAGVKGVQCLVMLQTEFIRPQPSHRKKSLPCAVHLQFDLFESRRDYVQI